MSLDAKLRQDALNVLADLEEQRNALRAQLEASRGETSAQRAEVWALTDRLDVLRAALTDLVVASRPCMCCETEAQERAFESARATALEVLGRTT